MKTKSKTGKIQLMFRVSQFLILNFFFFIVFTACSGRYVGLPRAEVLAYQTTPTYGNLYALSTAYGEALDAALKADTLHPGMYADYGVTLALMGHKATASQMLNAEVKAFPQSRGLVYRIKQRLLPDMLNDTLAVEGVNLDQLAAWAYDSLAALRPSPYVVPIIDSTDTAWISQQTPIDSVEIPIRLTANEKRELLAQQQMEAAQRKQYEADSIAAARQAVIDARKQAKADREKAKAEQDKARKEAQKEKQRQRDEERKQKAAERQAAKKAKEAERNNKKK